MGLKKKKKSKEKITKSPNTSGQVAVSVGDCVPFYWARPVKLIDSGTLVVGLSCALPHFPPSRERKGPEAGKEGVYFLKRASLLILFFPIKKKIKTIISCYLSLEAP